jgi:multiple sugar transport system permease protein
MIIDKKSTKWFHLVVHIVLVIGGLLCLYPIIYTVLAGFFTPEEFNGRTAEFGFFPWPDNPTFSNYIKLITMSSELGVYFFNSIVRTVYTVIFAVITSFIGGYAFSRLRWKGRDTVFMILLATIMIPGTVGMIPTFIGYKYLGIYDTFWVYLLGGPAINVMGTFLVRQTFDKISIELDEAAKIDGASAPRIMFQILFPLQKPILTFIAITTAIGVWNDWATSFFFTSNDRLQTLPGAITRLSSQMTGYVAIPNYPLLIAMSLAITIPSLIIFFVFQRYIVEGLANVGIKG